MTGTSRRAFLKATTLGLIAVTIPRITSAQQRPTINPSILELHDWEENNTPELPEFVDDKHKENVDKTTWSLNAYYGYELPAAIEEATPFSTV